MDRRVGPIAVIMNNAYREAVRARILHGLFALAMATTAYAIIVGEYASKDASRVLSDLGAASISVYGVAVAIVMGATSLYRELELKTLFPILARPLHRAQYLLGKYLGTLLTLLVFMLTNAAVLLVCVGVMQGVRSWTAPLLLAAGVGVVGILAWRAAALRTEFTAIALMALLLLGYWVAREAPYARQVVVVSVALSFLEVALVTAFATFFSAFSSPFLTAVFTLAVFVVGRSADTLANLPVKVFGQWVHDAGVFLSKIFPNLMVYVPARSVLVGEAVEVSVGSYLLWAGLQSVGWCALLLAGASWIFQRRDFV